MADDGDDFCWSFGIGSNMNVELVENKKGVKVLDSVGGAVPGWRMSFSQEGLDFVDPRYGNAAPMTEEEVAAGTMPMHGVALKLSLDDMAKMDKQEGYKPDPHPTGYGKVEVDVQAYDGRTFKAWVYSARKRAEEGRCSKRYLGVLVSGAKAAGLDETYIAALAKTPTYVPSAETLALRGQLPPLASLPGMTVEELAATNQGEAAASDEAPAYASLFGYVFKLPKKKVYFRSHRGRDCTARFSRHFRGISMDQDDDFGRPPYRLPGHFGSDEEREYVSQWMDHYIAKGGIEAIAAHLVEYREQLESEESEKGAKGAQEEAGKEE
eukprot:g5408.t1